MSKSYRDRAVVFAKEKSEGRHLRTVLPKREITSERQVRADLHGPAAYSRRADRAGALWPLGSREVDRIVEVSIRNIEVGMVKYVAGVCAKLQDRILEEMEVLSERHILRVDARPAQRIPARIASQRA